MPLISDAIPETKSLAPCSVRLEVDPQDFVLGLPGATPIAALAGPPTVYTIGVDNAAPTGHVFEYVDYFPREGVKVSTNDVLDFNWNPASSDGAHTATFLPKGTSLPPLALAEPTADEPGLQFNPDILFPSDPTCGSTKSNPCVYDGTMVVNSGFIFNANPTPPYFTDFYVKLDSKLLKGTASTEVKYVCEIHPGMVGSVTLVSDAQEATPVSTVQSMSARQLDDDTKGALNAEKSDSSPLVVHNANGATNVTAIAGTATPYVEVVEMLPSTLTIKPGDTITWVTKTLKDPHTVTFPRGPASDSVDPLPPGCEAPTSDTPPSEAGPPCPDPSNFELHLMPQPLGTSAISSVTTVGTSGVIGSSDAGFPTSFSFTFPGAGSFDYQCRIHDHMVGLVVVRP